MSHPGLPRGPAARACRSSCTRRTPGPGWPTGWARGSRRTSPRRSRARRCAHARCSGMPLRRADRDPRPGRARARGARRLRAGRRPPDAAGLRRLAGRPAAQRGRRGAPGALRAAGVQVLHVAGPEHGRAVDRRAPPAGGPAVRRRALPRPDGARPTPRPTWSLCRAGANTVRELDRRRPAGRLRAAADRQRRAGLNAEPVVEAGGGLLVDDADCTPDWVRDDADAAADRPGRLAAMAQGGGRVRLARRRRAAGRPGARRRRARGERGPAESAS